MMSFGLKRVFPHLQGFHLEAYLEATGRETVINGIINAECGSGP
jgi:hypothetical protein